MKTIKFNWRTPDPRVITVGFETDHNAEDVRFGVPLLEGEYMLLYITAGNYSDVIQLDHGVWHPSRTHTQRPARYEAYIERRKGHDVVWHSEPFAMIVDKLPPTKKKLEQAYPTAIEDALKAVETLTGMGAKIEMLPEGSEPTVSTEEADGRLVLVFGIPTGVGAPGKDGEDGVSPTIAATPITGGYQLTITDVNGTQTINVWDGKDGTGDGSGADGYSPTITVAEIEGGHRLTITDVNGSRTVDIMDGVDGAAGADGQPGAAGVSVTHSWNGAVLSVTSASGTTSANLKGEKGDKGDTGPEGPRGPQGEPGVSPTTATASLSASKWSNKTQTVSVSGVTASNNLIVTPAPASYDAYCEAGVRATAQANGTLTFECSTVPTENITANILIMG